MEILDLRHFSSVDLRPLLDDETRAWASLLSWDYNGSAEMILRYVDAKILPGICGDRTRPHLWLQLLRVRRQQGSGRRSFRGERRPLSDAREVEIKLLTHVIETLQQSPGIHRVEAQLLAHEAGSVARPFLDQGFQRHPRLFMVLRLNDSVPSRLRGASGYRNSALDRSRLPACSRRDYRRLSRPCRRPDQRPVPHAERIAALSEQHCALSGMRSVRCGIVLCGGRSQRRRI